MTEKMTEAARLYWKDLDVLDHARSQLVDYLDSVQQKWWERVRQLWQEDPLTSGQRLGDRGTGHKSPGHWWLHLPGESSVEVRIDVYDPRRSEADGQCVVKLTVSNKGMDRLKEWGKSVLPELGEVACQTVSDFSWDDRENLSRKWVVLNPEDATDTAERLAGTIFEYLKVLVLLEEKLKELESRV